MGEKPKGWARKNIPNWGGRKEWFILAKLLGNFKFFLKYYKIIRSLLTCFKEKK
jgi:hypothetical protein